MAFGSGFTQAINIKLIGSSNLKNSMGGAAKDVQKLKSALTDLRSAGLKLMGVGVGISTAFIGPIVQASKFNTQLVRTGKLAGVGADEMKILGDVAMELGAKTLFTAQQIAMGQEELVRLGFGMEVVGNKAGAFGEVLNYASAHQIEMNDSAQMLIGTLRSFNQPLTDAQKVSDMFSTVLSKTGFSMDGLTEALKMANTSIPAFNQSIETQLTLLGILANRQQGSSIGARRLSTAMTMIYTQQDKINKLFGTDTFKVYDEATGKQKNFIDVIFDMKKAMKSFSDEQQAVMLKDLVGTIGLKGLVPLLKAPVEEFKRLGIAINEGAISTSGFADAVRKTPKGMWLLMKSAISGVTMEIGQHLMPIATATMKIITMLSDKFLGFMKAHPILAKVVLISTALLGVLALLSGGLFLATSMLGLMMTSTSGLTTSLISMAATMTGTSVSSMTLSTALGVLSGVLWSILWPIGAIVLGAIALYKAWQHNFLGLKDVVDAAWTAIKPFFIWIKSTFTMISTWVKAGIGSMIKSIRDWYQSWNSSFTGMKSPLMAFAGLVAYVVGFIVGIFKRVFSAVKPYIMPLFKFLKTGFKGAFQIVTGILKTFFSFFSGIFKIIGSILKGDFSGALDAAKDMVKGMVAGIKTAFTGLWNLIKGVLGSIYNIFKITFVGAWNLIKAAVSGVWKVIKNVFSFIWDGIKWVVSGIKDAGEKILSALATPFQAGWELIKSVFNGVKSFFLSIFSPVFEWLSSTWQSIGNTISGVWNSVTTGFNSFTEKITTGVSSIADFFVSAFTSIKSTVLTIFNGISDAISGVWNGIKSMFTNSINWVIDKANSLIGGVNSVTGKVGIPAIPEIPKLAVGIMEVPQDMLAVIHKGEAVIPADQNPFKTGSNLTQSVINNTAYNQQQTKSVYIDRSVKENTIYVSADGGNPEDFKSKLMDVFEDLAGKSDKLEIAIP